MQSSLALVCDSANVTADGKLNVLGIFSVVYAHRFPATHSSLTLVLRFNNVLGTDGELELTGRFIDSDGEETITPISVSVSLNKGHDEAVSIINVNNLEFPRPGDYCFEIYAGKEHLASIPIKARSRDGFTKDREMDKQ